MHWCVVLTFDFLKNRSVVQILIGFGTAINSWAKVYKIFKAGLLTLTSGVLLNSNKTIEMTCDFWDFFVIEIKYSITKKTICNVWSQNISKCASVTKTLPSLSTFHTSYYPFLKKLIYCPTNIWIMKFEDQILNEPILLISRTCFCLVMDQEMVRRILPKKETETVDLF